MKRDPNLMREILLEMEASPDVIMIYAVPMGGTEEECAKLHHVYLLSDGGLVQEVENNVFRLTLEGHDFLDAIRDEGRWNKVLEKVSGGWSLDVLKHVALELLKKTIM